MFELYFQVMEKLVDIVHFLHVEIHEAFGSAGIHYKDRITFLIIFTVFFLWDRLWNDYCSLKRHFCSLFPS